jgi:epoxide hydrolase-like predicted phosphatase
VLGGLIVDFGGVLTEPGAEVLVAAARRHGLRTALLSNADKLGDDKVGDDDIADLFDTIVLSGQIGFGKPDVRIYLLTAERLGLTPEECVFVDDMVSNVRGAVRAGMVGVHHRDLDTTLMELNALFGIEFP